MRRIRLTIEYDGAYYCGWQRQPNGVSVQERLEKELAKLTGEAITLHGAGRTDSGVHALGQVAHFDTDSRIPAEKFCYALNAGLPNSIRVSESSQAPEGFHARFDAKARHYRYSIRYAPHACALTHPHELHVHGALDVGAMRDAAGFLIGEHDFASFMASGSETEDTIRKIYKSELMLTARSIKYDIIGNGFLYNMVRIIVGELLHIGRNKLAPEHMRDVLAARDRSAAADTAPAKGLVLMRVMYDDDAWRNG